MGCFQFLNERDVHQIPIRYRIPTTCFIWKYKSRLSGYPVFEVRESPSASGHSPSSRPASDPWTDPGFASNPTPTLLREQPPWPLSSTPIGHLLARSSLLQLYIMRTQRLLCGCMKTEKRVGTKTPPLYYVSRVGSWKNKLRITHHLPISRSIHFQTHTLLYNFQTHSLLYNF